jgi:hypothetical protein
MQLIPLLFNLMDDDDDDATEVGDGYRYSVVDTHETNYVSSV